MTSNRNINDVFSFGRELGRGAFSVVYEGFNKQTGKKSAVKQLMKARINDVNKVKNREISIMKSVNHPNIVHLEEVYEDEQFIHLVLEFVEGGELFDKIVRVGHLTEAQAGNIVRQVVSALQYLHSSNIIHRDLKPENILSRGNNVDSILVADFGFARSLANVDLEQVLTQCGSLHYTAPEILLNRPYGPPADMWSVGVVLYVLLTGCFPWEGEVDDVKGILSQIVAVQYKFPANPDIPISPQAKNLIGNLLVGDPAKRYTAVEVLADPWIVGKDISKIARHPSFINLLGNLSKNTKQARLRSSESFRNLPAPDMMQQ